MNYEEEANRLRHAAGVPTDHTIPDGIAFVESQRAQRDALLKVANSLLWLQQNAPNIKADPEGSRAF